MPFALGIVIGSIQAETMNTLWKPEFTANAEITNKELTIKDFAVYMNFMEDGKGASILYDDITRDWKEKDADSKYMRFLR